MTGEGEGSDSTHSTGTAAVGPEPPPESDSESPSRRERSPAGPARGGPAGRPGAARGQLEYRNFSVALGPAEFGYIHLNFLIPRNCFRQRWARGSGDTAVRPCHGMSVVGNGLSEEYGQT